MKIKPIMILLCTCLLLFTSCEDGGVSGLEDSGACDPCKIFVTATKYSGNLGGIAGADAKCASDAKNPKDGTYKALIGGTTRRGTAGNQLDWVIKPSTAYQRPNGTLIAYSTPEGLIPASLLASIYSSESLNIWTGLNIDGSVNASTCLDWVDSTWDQLGRAGLNYATDSQWINTGEVACQPVIRNLYCVQQ